MEVITEKIRSRGNLRVPKVIMDRLNWPPGEEVKLSIAGNRLIVEPLNVQRKRLKIKAEIIDQLVEHEEWFQPEGL